MGYLEGLFILEGGGCSTGGGSRDGEMKREKTTRIYHPLPPPVLLPDTLK